jgi:hypothetical protein
LLCRRRKQGKCGRKHQAGKVSDHSFLILSILPGRPHGWPETR